MKNIYILTLILFISICFGLYVGPHRVDSQYESYQNSPKEMKRFQEKQTMNIKKYKLNLEKDKK